MGADHDHPVDSAKVKSWISSQTKAGGTDAPKAQAIVDMLLAFDKKR